MSARLPGENSTGSVILAALTRGPRSLDALAAATRRSKAAVGMAVMQLRKDGHRIVNADGVYRLEKADA